MVGALGSRASSSPASVATPGAHDRAASTEKAFAAERSVAGIRALIIAFNSLVYAFLLPKDPALAPIAGVVIAGANVYGLFVWLAQPYRRFPAMMSSYVTSALDAGFITVWLFATGGVDSPFHPLWIASVTAIAFRYGYRATMWAAVLYSASYAGLVLALGQLAGHEADLVVRVGYIFFVAAIGGLLARESLAQTREKLETRALANALRESEERLRRLSDAAFEGIAIHEGGRILEANVAFAKLFGHHDPSDVVGKDAFDLFAPESHPVIADRIAHPSDRPYEVVGARADGTRIEVEITARDMPYKGRMARVVAIRDITERKKVGQLAELDRMKTQFINNAAHELATPLTPIKLQSHLLRVGSLGPLNEKQQRAVSVVERNADQLGFLVKDVLDSARLQAGRFDVRRASVDMGRLVTEAVESFDESARRAGVRIEADVAPGIVVQADGARLTQVVFNLLSNAIKFTPEGGVVSVSLARDPDADGARVTVRDSGGGVRPEDVPRLFQAFSQVHDTARDAKGGTGLGLYIAKGIVEAHGGRIWAQSEGLGEGATFVFTVPA